MEINEQTVDELLELVHKCLKRYSEVDDNYLIDAGELRKGICQTLQEHNQRLAEKLAKDERVRARKVKTMMNGIMKEIFMGRID